MARKNIKKLEGNQSLEFLSREEGRLNP